MARFGSNSSEGWLGLLLLILFSTGLLLTQRDNARERRTSAMLAGDVQAPVAAWLGQPFRKLEQALADADESRRALEENRALRRELVALRADNDRLTAARNRQKRLEALLAVELTGDIPDERIAARAVSDVSSPFVRSLLIGSGRDAGVRDGYAVISESGLVGHVVSAGRQSARVLRLDDLNSRVAVASDRSGARAILIGTNTDIPVLAFVADTERWAVGDRVVTSGDDGRLPQGLPVGTVTDGDPLTVRLDFHAEPVDWVFVLPFAGLVDADDPELDDVDLDAAEETTETETAPPVDGGASGEAGTQTAEAPDGAG
ncbi:rod shape-determining protein MreC [uncultured Algimonas sp.]|uniref:rod shape-determining protein MreC n=1 Tax=uncultured Algimonas sp. TaxID=1547920 RepID=UPI0026339CE8|nr:rod shape-determining protein MreC [uncultured Algimonas sp.]